MNSRQRNITFLIAIILLLIAAVSYEQSFYRELSNSTISSQAQRYITSKSKNIDKHLEQISQTIIDDEDLWSMNIPDNYLVFVSSISELDFWNSKRISPQNIPYSQQLTCRKIDNAWFLYKSETVESKRIDVLVNIKNNYSINNEYFNNDNATQGELSQYTLSETPQIGYNTAVGENNHPLFYFSKTELSKHNRHHSFLASISYIVLFFIVLLFLSRWHRNNYINIFSVVTFASTFILLVRFANLIPIFLKTSLFSTDTLSYTGVFSSMGLMILGSLFWAVLVQSLSKLLKRTQPNSRQALGLVLLLMVLFFVFMQRYIAILQTSDITLQLFKIRHLSPDTFWVYGILLLLLGGWGKLATVIASTFWNHKWALLYPLIGLVLCMPLVSRCIIPVVASALLLEFIIISFRKSHITHYRLLHLIITCLLLSLVTTIITETESDKRDKNNKEILIKSLPPALLEERDYNVEEQLIDIWNRIQQDQDLLNIPLMMFSTPEYYANYFRENYFSDQLKEYDLQVVICNPESYLHIGGSNTAPNCYDYFTDLLTIEGQQISNTAFHWQKSNNGRVSYFGWLKIAKGTLIETSIFLDLESPILSEGQGYPELLRDNSKNKELKPTAFSFARYANGKLITSSGDFRYPSTDDWVPECDTTLQTTDFEKQSHLCYYNNEDSFIVLSEEKHSMLYPLYAVIYTFLLFLFSFLIVHIISSEHKIRFKRSVSNDIRLTIYAVLLLSLLMVGTASVFFPLNIYKDNQAKFINEKSEVFLSTISGELLNINDIHNVPQSALQNLLLSLSNTVQKDVHIYDLKGRLYASSRPQLFNYKLQGIMMHPKAYHAFNSENSMSKIYTETIGNNEYKSYYYVISNNAEVPLAYVNVPFFSSQQDLKKSISDYLVILLNIYLLLIIAVITMTYFTVSAMTKPLLTIQEGLSRMKLGSNEKMVYKRDDEIGTLVEKYNIMVDELNASVEQLAQTEREVAWESMARQIAHEIKNPLTPMKLSIQHLARTKSASPKVFDEYFNKTATTLIEQIDNLSNIATSFSTFAKVSDASPECLNINERLSNISNLFEQSGCNINFTPCDEDIFVFMDRDHFIQVFNNLIKNAIQAIPKNQDGKIDIRITNKRKKTIISVVDNGTGIDEDTCDKIFQPNFTTKNSGMGLGLAISQKMVNSAGGKITFTPNSEIGTTFFVTLPQHNEA